MRRNGLRSFIRLIYICLFMGQFFYSVRSHFSSTTNALIAQYHNSQRCTINMKALFLISTRVPFAVCQRKWHWIMCSLHSTVPFRHTHRTAACTLLFSLGSKMCECCCWCCRRHFVCARAISALISFVEWVRFFFVSLANCINLDIISD